MRHLADKTNKPSNDSEEREKQYKTGRQGWLNEDNEIEEGSKHAVKKRLNRG